MTEPTEQGTPSQAEKERSRNRQFLVFLALLTTVIVLFVGGAAALLYLLFTQYSGIQSIWILVCCLPFSIIVGAFIIVFNLYTRFGRPLRQIFSAIDSVSEGDLSTRVPDDNSPQFGELIQRFNGMVGDLERSEQQRRNLTADIAHELRTPLHIIQGKLEGMLDGVYEPSPQNINDALDETKLLGRLVNDLQTLSLAETGQLPLHKTSFLVDDLIRDAKSSFAPQAKSQRVKLVTRPGLGTTQIQADYDRLSQVLSNLVANALRFTPRGGSITISSEQINEREVALRVEDTGSGIPEEDLPFVFDRFWRGEKSRTRAAHATSGLGLSISRQLVLAHGGTIAVASELGAGTRFEITLPNE